MCRRKNVIIKEDIYRENMDIVLLPDNIFDIEGYSAANIDDTYLIDRYIAKSMSVLLQGESIALYINYGFTRAVVSALNVIFQKNLECNIHIYNDAIKDYVNFGSLKKQKCVHNKDKTEIAASFQLINRPLKAALPKDVKQVFEEGQICAEHLFDASYYEQIAYDKLKKYEGRRVCIYITGLKQALIACINASRELDIELLLKHYNPDDESYEHEQAVYVA